VLAAETWIPAAFIKEPAMRYIGLPFLLVALVSCTSTLPKSDPNPPVISWGVMDKQLNQNTDFPATGGVFSSSQGHTFNVVLRADNPGGVQKITLDGSGRFMCATVPDSSGQSFTAPNSLAVSIPHQETTFTPDANNQIQTHAFLLYSLDYFKLSCGFHHFGNTPANLEYFAFSGTMLFSGSAQNYFAKVGSGTLSANP
jgi:hypothetical protein